MPEAYVIVTMKITDPEQYKQYMAAAPAAVKAHGGDYVVRGVIQLQDGTVGRVVRTLRKVGPF